MNYLLDTDTCIYVINRRPEHVFRRFRELRPGDIGISSITLSELRYGAQKSSNPARNLAALNEFTSPLRVFAFGEREAETYGLVRADLESRGEPIGAMDLLIGAHALSLGTTLVSNSLREFSRVSGLRIESWV